MNGELAAIPRWKLAETDVTGSRRFHGPRGKSAKGLDTRRSLASRDSFLFFSSLFSFFFLLIY